MYRLLIVTDNQNVKERLEAMQGWEALGFKTPRIRTGMEDAVECIHRHHIDAIAVEDSPAFEDFRAYLDEHFPNVPLFEIAPNETEQLLLLRELSGLLSRLKADDTNDLYDEAARMQEQRERWIKKVIGGLEISQGDMNRHIRLYRCTERLGVPCVLARLEMPEDDHFMACAGITAATGWRWRCATSSAVSMTAWYCMWPWFLRRKYACCAIPPAVKTA